MRVEQIRIGEHPALVFTLTRDREVGPSHLQQLRNDGRGSKLDSELRRAVLHANPRCKLLFLRGTAPGGEGRWRFAPELSDAECAELGYRLLKSQLPMYRDLARLGVLMFGKIAWGAREVGGFDEGRHRLLDELALQQRTDRSLQHDPKSRAGLALDVWHIRHLTFWVMTSLERSQAMLRRAVPRVLTRQNHVESLLAVLDEPDERLGLDGGSR